MQPALYYPILRAKHGEIEGLAHLSPRAKSRVRPLIDIPRQKSNDSRNLERYLADTLSSVARSHGTRSPLYIDLSRFGPDTSIIDGRHPVEFVYEVSRQLHLLAIPVTGPESVRGAGTRYLEAVSAIRRIAGLGCALRIPIAEFRSASSILTQLDSSLEDQELEPATTDLFLDAEALDRLPSEWVAGPHFETEIRNTLDAIKGLPFRAIVFAASSVPEQVGPNHNAKPLRIARTEMMLWKKLTADKSCQHISLGDYAVIPPFQDDSDKPVRAPSRIRLSTEREHIFYRGPRDQHRMLCQQVLRDQSDFGQAPSWGLAATMACGRGSGGIGGPTDWVARDVNMHIESTVEAVERSMAKTGRLTVLNVVEPTKEPWLQSDLGMQ